MKGKFYIPIIAVIVLSFLSVSLGVERGQVKPGAVQTRPAQVTPVELPDLVVESIWLDGQCQINFKLKNAGKGDIPDGEHRESAVRVQFEQTLKDFPLSKVDPRGVLKKSGGIVSFDTEIKLASAVDVKVIADFSRKIKEPEAGEKNNEKVAKLTPQCLAATQAPKVLTETRAKTELATKGKAAEGDTLQKSAVPHTTLSKVVTPKTSGKTMVPLSGMPAIMVTYPDQTTVAYLGSNLSIRWVTSGGAAANYHSFKIDLLDSKKNVVAVKISPPAGINFTSTQATYEYAWKVPNDLFLEACRVRVMTWDDKYFGESPDLAGIRTLGHPPGEIKVTSPKLNELMAFGDTCSIQWKTTQLKSSSTPPKERKIELLDGYGNLIKSITKTATDSGGDNTYVWKITTDVPKGSYIIKVSSLDDVYRGYSKNFMIVDKGIIVTNPSHATDLTNVTKWEKGKSYTIKWQAAGVGNSQLTVSLIEYDLLKTPQQTMNQIGVASAGATSWPYTVPSNISDGLYMVLVEANAFPGLGGIGWVCIAPPGVNCTLKPDKKVTIKSPSAGTVWSVGDDVKIEYEALGKVSTLKIHLVPIGFGDFTPIYIGTDSGSGTARGYPWKVASVKTGYYKFRITDYNSVAALAESEPFQIIPPSGKPFIQVTSPWAGAQWFMGSTYSIKWETSGPVDLNSPTTVCFLAPDGLAYSLSMPAIKLGAKSFSWKITPDPTTTQPGQFRIRVSSGEGHAYSQPFTILSTPVQKPNSGTFKIVDVKRWMYGPDPSKLSTVEVIVQANTDQDFTIGDYGHPDFGSLYLDCNITNFLLQKNQPSQWDLYGLASLGTYSCKSGGSSGLLSKPLEFPTGLIKKGQTFSVSVKFDPPLGGIQGVKTQNKSYFPEVFVRLYGHTLSGVSTDEKKVLITGADLVDVPPGVKLNVPAYITQ